MLVDWEQELAELLAELSSVQHELLTLLSEKQRALVRGDLAALDSMGPRVRELIDELEGCRQRRAELLAMAAEEGREHENLLAVTATLEAPVQARLAPRFNKVSGEMRVLAQRSLTNWLVCQRSLIHLAQLLEILATGGRPDPTYGRGPASAPSGALVDQAV